MIGRSWWQSLRKRYNCVALQPLNSEVKGFLYEKRYQTECGENIVENISSVIATLKENFRLL